MRILKLRAENFRRFTDLELEFDEGINLVRGPNESGKSTLVLAILTGLFARPQPDTSLARSYMRWGTDDAPVIELDFIQEGSAFHLVKDFTARTVLLEEEGGPSLKSLKAVNSRVFDLIGFSDPARYLRTACVTHDQMVSLAEDSSGARKIAGMLREIVVGGRESKLMENAVKKLSAEVDSLKRGLERPTTNPGSIKKLVEEREALIVKQKELSANIGELEEQRERLTEIEAELERREPRLKELNELLDKNRPIAELKRRAAEARARFEAADRVREAARELARVDEKIDANFGQFREVGPRAEPELRRAGDLRESLVSLRDELASRPVEQTPEPEPAKQPSRSVASLAGVGLGTLLVVLGILLGALIQPALYALAAVGLMVAVAGLTASRGRKPAPVTVPPVSDAQRLLVDRIQHTDGEIRKLEGREREFLDSVGYSSADQFFDSFAAYSELTAERDRAEAGLKALLGGRAMEQADEERRQGSLDAASCEERLADLEQFHLAPEELRSLSREREALSGDVEAMRKERDALAFHLIRTATEFEEATRLEEELAWLWESEQATRRRLRVHTIARDGMQETAEKLLSSAVPVLSESVGRTISRLTGGRYDTVDVRESDLALSVFSPEKGDMIPADEVLATLSKGTASQLYLAARLELVDLLSGGHKPPLIFDDSFSYFDVRRLGALWDVLLEVARDQQVLVLTCTDRYDNLAGPDVNVIDLG